MERLISLFGLVIMMALAWLMSSNRRHIPARVIVGGLFLQFAFAAFILRTNIGRIAFDWLGTRFTDLLSMSDAGAEFVFGEQFRDHFFAFKILPTIIFFSSLMSLLYYLGVMQQLIKLLAVVMQRTLNTSGAESLSAAANIFVGQTEAPLVIRPYVAEMTNSELMAVMVGGFATVAGGVLAFYASMGIDARHLLSASVISAPAALVIAKIMQPEIDHPKTLGHVELDVGRDAVNMIHAITNGAAAGVKLAINVGAMIIAFLALIALVNALLGWGGSCFGQQWSLEGTLSYLFAPLAWVMGVESGDCLQAGQLLGMKMVTNEAIAYAELAKWLEPGSPITISPRSQMITTYALCGFANFGSIGIQVGGIGPLAPARRPDLARLGFRAMLGGTLAAFMTACVAGVLL